VTYPIPEETVTPGRRRGGWLWGCLGVVIIAIVLAGGGVYYTAKHLFREMQNDPKVAAIADIVRGDAEAMAKIGGDFQVMEIERKVFPLPKSGFATTYRLTLAGPRGLFVVEARFEPAAKGQKMTSLTLTDPEGGVYRPRAGPSGTAI
jgi:hypothetical protein